jgi:hypothetical protein
LCVFIKTRKNGETHPTQSSKIASTRHHFLRKVFQVRRRLAFLGRHQKSILAHVITFRTDPHLGVGISQKVVVTERRKAGR